MNNINLLKRLIKESVVNLDIHEKVNEIIKYLHYMLEEDYTRTNLFRVLLNLSVSETKKDWNMFEDKKIELMEYIISTLEIFEGERGVTESDLNRFERNVYDKISDFFNDIFEIIVENSGLEEKQKNIMIIEFVEKLSSYYRLNFMKKYVGDERVKEYISDKDPAQKMIDALKISNEYDEQTKKLVDAAKQDYDTKIRSGMSTIQAQKEMEEYLKLFYDF